MSKTNEQIIDEMWDEHGKLLEILTHGYTKEQWKEDIKKPQKPRFKRCENCIEYPCNAILGLREKYPMFCKIWHKFGCSNCPHFIPKKSVTK